MRNRQVGGAGNPYPPRAFSAVGQVLVLTSGGVAALVAWSPEQTFYPPYAKWFCSPHLGFNSYFLTSEFTPEPLQEPGRLRGTRSFPHTTLLLICTAVIAETKAAVRYCPPCQGGIHACKNHSRGAHWLWVVLAPGFDPALTALHFFLLSTAPGFRFLLKSQDLV